MYQHRKVTTILKAKCENLCSILSILSHKKLAKCYLLISEILFSVSTYSRYPQGLKEEFLLIKVIYMEKSLENLCSKDKVHAFIDLKYVSSFGVLQEWIQRIALLFRYSHVHFTLLLLQNITKYAYLKYTVQILI